MSSFWIKGWSFAISILIDQSILSLTGNEPLESSFADQIQVLLHTGLLTCICMVWISLNVCVVAVGISVQSMCFYTLSLAACTCFYSFCIMKHAPPALLLDAVYVSASVWSACVYVCMYVWERERRQARWSAKESVVVCTVWASITSKAWSENNKVTFN